jgi:hypothetical protein
MSVLDSAHRQKAERPSRQVVEGRGRRGIVAGRVKRGGQNQPERGPITACSTYSALSPLAMRSAVRSGRGGARWSRRPQSRRRAVGAAPTRRRKTRAWCWLGGLRSRCAPVPPGSSNATPPLKTGFSTRGEDSRTPTVSADRVSCSIQLAVWAHSFTRRSSANSSGLFFERLDELGDWWRELSGTVAQRAVAIGHRPDGQAAARGPVEDQLVLRQLARRLARPRSARDASPPGRAS